jgi:hypothetical protein
MIRSGPHPKLESRREPLHNHSQTVSKAFKRAKKAVGIQSTRNGRLKQGMADLQNLAPRRLAFALRQANRANRNVSEPDRKLAIEVIASI